MIVADNKPNVKLSKEERLCSKKSIDKLFAEGDSFIAYPLRVVYIYGLKADTDINNQSQILVSVSKKKFKRANKRNRVKRLIREGYRLNKHQITEVLNNKGVNIDIAFLYLKDELPLFKDIEKAMIKTFNILSHKLDGEINEV